VHGETGVIVPPALGGVPGAVDVLRVVGIPSACRGQVRVAYPGVYAGDRVAVGVHGPEDDLPPEQAVGEDDLGPHVGVRPGGEREGVAGGLTDDGPVGLGHHEGVAGDLVDVVADGRVQDDFVAHLQVVEVGEGLAVGGAVTSNGHVALLTRQRRVRVMTRPR